MIFDIKEADLSASLVDFQRRGALLFWVILVVKEWGEVNDWKGGFLLELGTLLDLS